MAHDFLETLRFDKPDDPDPHADLRTLLTDWLDWQRQTFLRKLRDLDHAGIAQMAVPPLELSIVGLVRHMTQMEHVYLAWGLGGGERSLVYGDDDFAGGSPETVENDWLAYRSEVTAADRAIASLGSLDSPGAGHGRPLGATLVKMVQEYAVHNGQAHMLRYAALGEIRR